MKWILENLEQFPGHGWQAAANLHKAYQEYCESTEKAAVNNQQFNRAIRIAFKNIDHKNMGFHKLYVSSAILEVSSLELFQ